MRWGRPVLKPSGCHSYVIATRWHVNHLKCIIMFSLLVHGINLNTRFNVQTVVYVWCLYIYRFGYVI